MHVSIDPGKVLAALLCSIGFLVIMDAAGTVATAILGLKVFGLNSLFSLNREGNVPSFYSASALAAASALLLLVAFVSRRQRLPHRAWVLLAVVFSFLSIDEIASVHERLGDRLGAAINPSDLQYYNWPIAYGIAVLIGGLASVRFLLALPRRTAGLFVTSGALLVTGAIGFELISFSFAEAHGFDTLVYRMLYAVEETLEMTGVALFIYSLLDYIARQFPMLTFAVGSPPTRDAA